MTQIVFLILPNVHLLDLAGPDQVFHEAIDGGADLKITYCSTSANIQSSAGLPFGKILDFKEICFESGDFLFIPGANTQYILSAEFKLQSELFQWIRAAYAKKINICSICTGAYVLAHSGILDGKQCTTHWQKTQELQEKFPKIKVQENILFSKQDNIYTSAGIVSGIDMALFVLEEIEGAYFSHKIARMLVMYNRRSGQQSQQSIFLEYRNHLHSGIHKVQDWLIENINKKTSILQLADMAYMSDRNFTRVFKKEAGVTVNEYINLLRKEKVKELLKKTDFTRKQIAEKIGLESERQLNRLMQTI
jgi:transcriptional regulator GlxA family with amidase domain